MANMQLLAKVAVHEPKVRQNELLGSMATGKKRSAAPAISVAPSSPLDNAYSEPVSLRPIVVKLIEYQCDIDQVNDLNQTALWKCCEKAHWDLLQILLDRGDGPGQVPRDPKTLPSEQSFDCVDLEHGRSALMWCCMHRNLQVVQQLLSLGADPNICDINGMSCLHVAAAYNDVPLARLLINSGALRTVDFEAHGYQTPLKIACDYGYSNMSDLLIGAGANAARVDVGLDRGPAPGARELLVDTVRKHSFGLEKGEEPKFDFGENAAEGSHLRPTPAVLAETGQMFKELKAREGMS